VRWRRREDGRLAQVEPTNPELNNGLQILLIKPPFSRQVCPYFFPPFDPPVTSVLHQPPSAAAQPFNIPNQTSTPAFIPQVTRTQALSWGPPRLSQPKTVAFCPPLGASRPAQSNPPGFPVLSAPPRWSAAVPGPQPPLTPGASGFPLTSPCPFRIKPTELFHAGPIASPPKSLAANHSPTFEYKK
jgi:hypothetical protein